MSRYDIPGGEDAQYEPGSNGLVLRNKLGITSPAEIDQVESELLGKAIADSYEWAYLGMQFTAEIIRKMHRLWLGEVYDFAGELRTVNMSKPGALFCPWPNISAELKRLEP